jgi:DNA invertase Pin-like site-specific DNA recombinase
MPPLKRRRRKSEKRIIWWTLARHFCTAFSGIQHKIMGNLMARKAKTVEAVAYIRTSSAANVGADKDSDKRQRTAIEAFAKRSGFALVCEFNDAAVRGADPIEARPGFAALLDKIEGNGVRVVIVEDASRFARELMTQELGLVVLINRGVKVYTASGDELTDDSDPSRVMMRQIAGAFHQYEKARLVGKLKAARDRKRATGVKVEGRKSWSEVNAEIVRAAKAVRGRGDRRSSFRAIAAALAEQGHHAKGGNPFSPSVIKSMLKQKTPPTPPTS